MPYTAEALVRELGYRKHDLVLATAAGGGTTTTLVSTDLLPYMPSNVAKLNGWVYGSLTAAAGNIGIERIATSWTSATTTLTLPVAMPSAMTAGVYELNRRYTHERKLEAINSATALLDLYWYRPIRDESLTTIANTYRYTLPNTIPWSEEGPIKVLIQVTTDATVTGYPFMDATRWNPTIEREVSSIGVELYYLRFGIQPPPGRTLRLLAPVGFSALAAGGDILTIDGSWGRKAREYILDKASLQLDNWSLDYAANNEDTQRTLAIIGSRLERLREQLMRTAQGHENSLITVPGQRDGLLPSRPTPMSHLAAFSTPGP